MSLGNVKIVAFDMDGTLLNGESRMAEETKHACHLLQQQGCKLVIATGRNYYSAKLPVDEFPFDGYVCSNGAAVYEQDGTLVQSTLLSREAVLDTISKLRGKQLYYEVHDAANNRWMVQEDREQIETLLDEAPSDEGVSWRKFSFHHLSRAVPEKELVERIQTGESEIVKIFVWHTNPDELIEVREQLTMWEEQVTITSSGNNNFEMIAKGVSKASGLQYFLDKWEIKPEESAAFGDADNDLEIFSLVGNPIAMENGTDQLKQLAKFIAPDHQENGVATFIMQRLIQPS
ncbi:HAD family hydrolase [Brevibacillus sp. SYSU BS000544]|uniref:HAD family hydrolase n=1 Tax=Brevibacillus sp. SYSU BS000544 TaxID=3416443 RepID=UPI003CE5822E